MRDPQLQYQRQSVINASPVKIVIKLYDLAIQATYREDDKRLREILSTLIKGLNFDHEPAGQLFNIYQYCQEISREGRFDEIRELLEPIREAWEESAGGAMVRNANGSAGG
jgi:flagellin-specific chaperone FliS